MLTQNILLTFNLFFFTLVYTVFIIVLIENDETFQLRLVKLVVKIFFMCKTKEIVIWYEKFNIVVCFFYN